MTSREVIASLVRAWWIVAVGLCVTVAACVGIRAQAGSYWAQTNVYFLAPTDADNVNTLAFTTDGVIATAGLVAHEVAPSSGPVTNTDTSLVAEGVRDGHRVRLPSSGGQWAVNFDRPVLDVQVVADYPDRVRSEMTRLLGDIDRVLADLQDSDNVAPTARIRTNHAPATVQIRYAQGKPSRAMAATVLLGGAATTVIASAYGRRRTTRTRATAHDVATPREPVGVS